MIQNTKGWTTERLVSIGSGCLLVSSGVKEIQELCAGIVLRKQEMIGPGFSPEYQRIYNEGYGRGYGHGHSTGFWEGHAEGRKAGALEAAGAMEESVDSERSEARPTNAEGVFPTLGIEVSEEGPVYQTQGEERADDASQDSQSLFHSLSLPKRIGWAVGKILIGGCMCLVKKNEGRELLADKTSSSFLNALKLQGIPKPRQQRSFYAESFSVLGAVGCSGVAVQGGYRMYTSFQKQELFSRTNFDQSCFDALKVGLGVLGAYHSVKTLCLGSGS